VPHPVCSPQDGNGDSASGTHRRSASDAFPGYQMERVGKFSGLRVRVTIRLAPPAEGVEERRGGKRNDFTC
jgi:hypothetical protein